MSAAGREADHQKAGPRWQCDAKVDQSPVDLYPGRNALVPAVRRPPDSRRPHREPGEPRPRVERERQVLQEVEGRDGRRPVRSREVRWV